MTTEGLSFKSLKSTALSPGLTSETVYMVNMEVTAEQGKQELDDSEDIEVILLPRKNAADELKKYISNNPEVVIDTKVWLAIFS